MSQSSKSLLPKVRVAYPLAYPMCVFLQVRYMQGHGCTFNRKHHLVCFHDSDECLTYHKTHRHCQLPFKANPWPGPGVPPASTCSTSNSSSSGHDKGSVDARRHPSRPRHGFVGSTETLLAGADSLRTDKRFQFRVRVLYFALFS